MSYIRMYPEISAEAEWEYHEQLGREGSLNDKLKIALEAEGYDGSVEEMLNQWWSGRTVGATSGAQLQFDQNEYNLGGSPASLQTIDSDHTRASSKYAEDKEGNWQEFANGSAAILPGVGYVSNESWTNLVTNPQLTGLVEGVIGSGGALPSGWGVSTVAGLTVTVARASRFGLDGVSFRYQGTNTSGGIAYPHVEIERNAAAALGETFTTACTVYTSQIVDRSGIAAPGIQLQERSSGGGFLATIATNSSPDYFASVGRHDLSVSGTTANASVAFCRPLLNLAFSDGGTIDVTFEIYAPRLIKAAYDVGYGEGAVSADALVISAADAGMDVTPSSTGVTTIWRGIPFASELINSRCAEIAVDGGNRLSIIYQQGNLQYGLTFASGGSFPGQVRSGNLDEEATIGITWRSDGSYAISKFGLPQTTGSGNPAMVGTIAAVSVGCGRTGDNPLNADCKHFACLPNSVTDAELEALVALVAKGFEIPSIGAS